MRTMLLAAGAATIAASCAHAQSQGAGAPPAPAAPRPPCQEELFRQFDFWAGEWEVFTPQGAKAGDNSITIEEYGCLLVEHWTTASGITGQSYNYVNLENNKWRQIWVSGGSTIDYSGGLNDKGEMVLEGTIAYRAGSNAPFRGVWTPNPDGSVTQHFQQFDPQANIWSDWFVGVYKRKGAGR